MDIWTAFLKSTNKRAPKYLNSHTSGTICFTNKMLSPGDGIDMTKRAGYLTYGDFSIAIFMRTTKITRWEILGTAHHQSLMIFMRQMSLHTTFRSHLDTETTKLQKQGMCSQCHIKFKRNLLALNQMSLIRYSLKTIFNSKETNKRPLGFKVLRKIYWHSWNS